MTTLKMFVAVSGLMLASAMTANAETASLSTCNPVQQVQRTDFPQSSQQNGEYGTVRLAVKIGSDGRANDVRIAKSSGYRSLDQAAADSVRTHWRFDVSHCSAEALIASRTVNIQFQRAAQQTVSTTVSQRVAALEKKLLVDNRCDITRDAARNAVFACISNESVTSSEKLAQRSADQ